MNKPYRPQGYWSDRLSDGFDLRATGHRSYSREYNNWLYRAKGRALQRCLRGLPPGAAVLDVGSGIGWVVQQLRDQEMRVEGCDIAAMAIEQLQRKFEDSSFFELAIGTDPIPRGDASYDAVTMLDVAYHITDDELWRAALLEIARVLKPGGRLIVSDGLGDSDREPAPHVRFRSIETWRAGVPDTLAVTDVRPYFRWLSRDRNARLFNRVPDGPRGAIEFALESLAPRAPHMRCAVLVKRS